jgi:hypothetical protein
MAIERRFVNRDFGSHLGCKHIEAERKKQQDLKSAPIN